ncbi:MAG TPA: transcription antitermination factor NusB [Candidatus Acidoferrales bacterium]|nr:transcription antitermination factor NusB [Candidatus Acidoferrales bacterium]
MASQRRLARERVLQTLYAYEMSGTSPDFLSNDIFKDIVDRAALEFARKLFRDTLEHVQDLDLVLQGHLDHWDISRVNPVDRSLLRMGVAEILFAQEIPTKVTMNEIIELAKRYSTEESPKFVNGILDASLKQLSSEGKIKKSGRGLVNTSVKKKL